MNVNIAPRGHSTKAVTAYLLNPKRDDPQQLERVGNTETFNLYTDDIEKAAGWMAWVDGNREFIQQENGGDGRGRPATAGNVYHLSLSWHPDDQPSWEHMRDTALSAMEERGLREHQFYLVEHTEQAHKHVHIVANLVHPETGKVANCYKDRDVLDAWANEYEHGRLQFERTAEEYRLATENEKGIQCEQRADKYEAWEQDRDAFPDRAKKLDHTEAVTTAFERSDSGQAFQAALAEEGLTLARGRRRAFVVVDQNGDISNLSKVIDFTDGTKGRAKTNAIREKMSDLPPDDLDNADSVAAERVAELERDDRGSEDGGGEDDRQAALDAGSAAAKQHQKDGSDDSPTAEREAQEVAQKKTLADAAHKATKHKGKRAEQLAAEEKRRRTEEAAARKQQRQREEQQRWERFHADLSRKTAASREKWQIDQFTRQQEQAQHRVDDLRGFWSRIFKPFQRRDALDQLNNATLQLQERTSRFEADVQAFKREEPSRPQAQEIESSTPKSPALQPSPQPEPASTEPPSPSPHEKDEAGLSEEQRRAADKQAFLDRQRERRQEQRDEPDRKPELDRE